MKENGEKEQTRHRKNQKYINALITNWIARKIYRYRQKEKKCRQKDQQIYEQTSKTNTKQDKQKDREIALQLDIQVKRQGDKEIERETAISVCRSPCERERGGCQASADQQICAIDKWSTRCRLRETLLCKYIYYSHYTLAIEALICIKRSQRSNYLICWAQHLLAEICVGILNA